MKTPDLVAKEILAKLAVTAPGFSLELGTPERKIVDAVAESISEAYIDQYLIGSLMDIESKAGLELEQWVGTFGFGRLQGRKASGTVRVELNNSNPQDITIQSGNPFYTRQALPSSGNPVYFTSTQAVIIPAGSYVADVPVECTVVGTSGNIPPDSIVYVGDILGATTVTNLQAFTGGVDIETDDELRQRFKDTFLRNVTGTEDFYLGLCYQNRFISKAAVLGPVRKYATQVLAEENVNLADYISQDVKYVWPGEGHVHVFKDLGQETEAFYQSGSDFTWVAGASPSFTWLSGGDIANGSVVDLEFEYTSRSSRNDPVAGITNKIDIFVNGVDPYVVTERTVVDDGVRISSTDTDPLYQRNFVRVGPTLIRGTSELTNAKASVVSISGSFPVFVVTLTNDPDDGVWTLNFGGTATGDLEYNATPGSVESALTGLPGVGVGNVTVAHTLDVNDNIVDFSYTVTFNDDEETGVTPGGLSGASSMTNMWASEVVVSGTTVTLTNTPTGGTYTLSYGSEETSSLAYNASTSAVQAALVSLTGIGAGNATVTGTPTEYTITLDPDTKLPLVNNRFTRLGSCPVVSFPSTLVVGGTVYTQGVHYHLLRLTPEAQTVPNQVALMAGSIHELVGVEWESTGPVPESGTTVPVTYTYTYNRVPELVQAVVKTSKQITTDVLIHQAGYAYIDVHLSVEYERGFVVSQVNNAIQERLRAFFAAHPFGAWIEFSDVILSVHQVLGVDNVTITADGDPGSSSGFGIDVYASSEDNIPLATHTSDFKLLDSQLPVFMDAVIWRKANR